MNAEAWLFAGTFVTAICGVVLAIFTSRSSALTQAIQLLKDRIKELQTECDAKDAKIEKLEAENEQLRKRRRTKTT